MKPPKEDEPATGEMSVAFPFLLVFAILSVGTWTLGHSLGPGLDAFIVLSVCSVTLLAATALAVGLTLLATDRVEKFDRVIRILDAYLGPRGPPGSETSAAEAPRPHRTASIDAARADGRRRVDSGRRGPSSRREPLGQPGASRAARSAEALRAERITMGRARGRIWAILLGPMATAMVFSGVAGTVLLGASNVGPADYAAVGAAVLFLSFGWALLLIWIVVAVWRLPSVTQFEGPRDVQP